MNIDQLIQQPEGKQLEFTRDLSSPQPLLKALVAFANTSGGQLIIGISDDGDVIGVDDPLSEEERLSSLIADSISPRLVPSIELLTVAGKTLLKIEVYLSSSRPHYLKAKGPDHGVIVRIGSSNRQADSQLIAELQRQAAGETFDAMPMPELSLDDLDRDAMQKQFGANVQLDEQKLLTLKLLVRNQDRLVPSKGAILLFGKQRLRYFDDAWVQCGRFRGTDKVDIFDQAELHDHLPQAADSIELFLKKHAFKSAEFSGMRRTDHWSIPLTILREAIINALVHSDYSQRGSPIRIAFFDDRIEVESPGMLMPGMTIEDMKRGVSMIRNPVIARVFRELKLIEQWGSGVQHIFAEAASQGLPEPRIEEVANRLRFIISLSQTQAANQSRPESRPESDLTTKILENLAEHPMGKAEIAKAIGHKSVSGQLKKQVKWLQEQKLIEMTIPDKPNSRLQKYRLTDKGLQRLKDLS